MEQALKAADDHPAIPRERGKRLGLLRRAMIPALAGVDPDTGTPRRRVARLDEIPAETPPLVQLLIDQHLLTTDVSQETGETTVEPAHEALLRQWSTLEGWLDEESEDLAMAESVRRAAREWEANGRDGGWLVHAGARLQLADRIAAREDFANIFRAQERAYLAACHEAEEARRVAEEAARRREIAAQKQRRNIFAGAFVVSLVLLALAGWQWWEARRQEQEAVTAARTAANNAAGALASLARIEADRERGDPVKAAKLALAAWPRDQTSGLVKVATAVDVLRDVLPRLQRKPWLAEKFGPGVWSGRLALDGRYLIRQEGRATFVHDTLTGEIAHEVEAYTGTGSYAVSPDGQWLAVTSVDKPLVLNLATGETHVPDEAYIVTAVTFTDDSRHLVFGRHDGVVDFWDLVERKRTNRLKFEFTGAVTELWYVALSSDGSHIAAGSRGGQVEIRPVDNPAHPVVRLESELDELNFLAFLYGNDRLVTGQGYRPTGSVAELQMWSTATGRLAGPPNGEDDASPVWKDGKIASVSQVDILDGVMAIGTQAGKTCLLGRGSDPGEPVERGPERSAGPAKSTGRAILRTILSADGRWAATVSEDGFFRIWEIATSSEIVRFYMPAVAPIDARFLEGGRLQLGLADGTVRLVDIDQDALTLIEPVAVIDGRHVGFDPLGRYRIVLEPRINAENSTDDRLPSARIYEIATGSEIATPGLDRALADLKRSVDALALGAGLRKLALLLNPPEVQLVDLASGETTTLPDLDIPIGYGAAVAFSPGGEHLAVSGGDRAHGALVVYDLRTKQPLSAPIPLAPPGVDDIAFLPDGTRLFASTNHHEGIVTATIDNIAAAPAEGQSPVRSTKMQGKLPLVLADGDRLLTSTAGGLALWDIGSETPIARFDVGIDLRPVGIQANTGRAISVRSGQVEYWDFSDLPPGDGFDVVCAYLPDASLANIVEDSPVSVDFEICGHEYDPPLPDTAPP